MQDRPSLVRTFVAAALAFVAAGSALAQAPDCGGISPVYNSDPDLIGELTTVRVASGLSSPVFATAAPGDAERLFIVEQTGTIRILKDGVLQATPFLDATTIISCCGERGLLGLAFPPDYQTFGFFFVYFTNTAGNLEVDRFRRSSPDLAGLATRQTVITVPHPTFGNHNGGTVAFSPLDGHLYLGTGDGGSGCDPGPGDGNALNLTSNLGKILRLDVRSLPYKTAGNPFDGATPGNDEIWSYGARNPYRFSFDRVTGAIYIGDVGQGAWEEVDCSPGSSAGGENYGWANYEGDHCPNPSCGSSSCIVANYVPPIREYNQASAPCAITGGNVYRGCRMPDLRGTYFYSDYCDAFIKTFRTDATCPVPAGPDPDRRADLAPGGGLSINSIVGYGEDHQGELYIVDLGGEVFKVLPTLGIMEVSGRGAEPLIHGPVAWSWEDLAQSSGHAIASYRVYRADAPTGSFSCVQNTTGTSWTDPDVPTSEQAYFYLVTARHASGEESVAGADSDGLLRVVDTLSACP